MTLPNSRPPADTRRAIHERAVRSSLSWADAAADEHDYTGALEWLDALEAIGERLSDDVLAKRVTWRLALQLRGPVSADDVVRAGLAPASGSSAG